MEAVETDVSHKRLVGKPEPSDSRADAGMTATSSKYPAFEIHCLYLTPRNGTLPPTSKPIDRGTYMVLLECVLATDMYGLSCPELTLVGWAGD